MSEHASEQTLADVRNRATVSIDIAAAKVGVTRRTIYHWIETGKIDHVRTAGGRVRIFEDSLWRDSAAPDGTGHP